MSTGKLRKRSLEATPDLSEAIDALMPVGDGEQPEITAYFDGLGNVRRMVAVYPNKWQLRVNLDARGRVTSSSASLKLTAKIGGVKA